MAENLSPFLLMGKLVSQLANMLSGIDIDSYRQEERVVIRLIQRLAADARLGTCAGHARRGDGVRRACGRPVRRGDALPARAAGAQLAAMRGQISARTIFLLP